MPHQCVRCGTIYDDGSNEILKGCSCGAKMFFYLKKAQVEAARQETENLTEEEKTQIEKDVLDIVGAEIDQTKPVILDLEAIRVVKPGKFEIDLIHLFKDDPLIYKLGEGKYVIDLPNSFASSRKNKE